MTVIRDMANAMANAKIGSDEGDFPRLFDMLDFSGENNAWLVTYGLARAALEALRDSFADPVVRAAIQAALDEKEAG